MRQSEFIRELREKISEEEWEKLAEGGKDLLVSDFNREKLLELKEREGNDAKSVDLSKAEEFHGMLQKFLDTYMKENPEGHKWIILSCLYLAFVAEEPLHPMDKVGSVVRYDRGRKVYFCPLKDVSEESTCRYCVCRKLVDMDSTPENLKKCCNAQ